MFFNQLVCLVFQTKTNQQNPATPPFELPVPTQLATSPNHRYLGYQRKVRRWYGIWWFVDPFKHEIYQPENSIFFSNQLAARSKCNSELMVMMVIVMRMTMRTLTSDIKWCWMMLNHWMILSRWIFMKFLRHSSLHQLSPIYKIDPPPPKKKTWCLD